MGYGDQGGECKESDLRIGKPIQSAPWSGASVVYGSGPPLVQRHNKRGGSRGTGTNVRRAHGAPTNPNN
jgi:hypothetical protein